VFYWKGTDEIFDQLNNINGTHKNKITFGCVVVSYDKQTNKLNWKIINCDETERIVCERLQSKFGKLCSSGVATGWGV